MAGETLIQGALEAVTTQHTFGKWDEKGGILRTFGRWDENTWKLRTFGRWEMHGGRRNTETGRSRSCDDSAHLRKVGRKRGETAHLPKVGNARRQEKPETGRSRSCDDSAHLRKVG